MSKKQIKIDGRQMRFSGDLVRNSVNAEARTAELVWTTGYKGLRRSIFGSYYEELSMRSEDVDLSRLNTGAPLLANHDASDVANVIGVVERAWIDTSTNEGKAIVRFASDEKTEVIFQKVREGILKNVSVGYDVGPDDYELVDGDEEIPTYRAKKWQPVELSIVPIGFDPNAHVRSNEETEIKNYNVLNKTQKESVNMDELEKQKQAEAARQAAVTAEKTRIISIRKLVADAGLEAGLADEYIERDVTVEQAKVNVDLFKKYQKETPVRNTTVEISETNEIKRREALENMLLNRINAQAFKLSDDGRMFAGSSFLRALEQIIPRKSFENDYDYAQRTMSSSDLPLILSNVANKAAQKSYELAAPTFREWAAEGTLKDYKQSLQVRGGDVMELKKRNEAGEYQESIIGEEGENVQLEQYGGVHKFTDKMLVNDDLGMILDIANRSGGAVARLEDKLCYDVLTANAVMGDNVAFFDNSTHGNTGTVGAISETTLNEMRQKMRVQKSVGKKDFLNLSPSILLVGPALETEAQKILAAVNPAQTSNVNVFQNSMKLVVSPLITDDRYYGFADKSRIESVKLFRLQGQESAKVSSRVNWRNDAIEMKIAHAATAAAVDYRGAFRNKKTSF